MAKRKSPPTGFSGGAAEADFDFVELRLQVTSGEPGSKAPPTQIGEAEYRVVYDHLCAGVDPRRSPTERREALELARYFHRLADEASARDLARRNGGSFLMDAATFIAGFTPPWHAPDCATIDRVRPDRCDCGRYWYEDTPLRRARKAVRS